MKPACAIAWCCASLALGFEASAQGTGADYPSRAVTMVIPHAQAGKLRILATSGRTRSTVLKDVPTMAEAGVKDYEVIGWWGLFAPAKTPRAVLDRLHGELARALASPAVAERLKALGTDVPPSGSMAAARDFVRSQSEKFRVLVDAAGGRID